MAQQKPVKKRTAKTGKSAKRPDFKTHLKRSIAGLFILVLLVVSAGVLAHYMMRRKMPEQSLPAVKPAPVYKKEIPPPAFEIFPKEEAPLPKPVPAPEIPLPEKQPRAAIIIDDLGYDRGIAEKFLELDAVLTFSVLPYSPFQKKIARAAHEKGYDTMLHLPMEPFEYPDVDPGLGALLTAMSPDQLIKQLNDDLDTVPFIKGVNNHMGSKMTTLSPQIYQIFSVLKKRNLFFIDSRSTHKTICRPSARLFQIPFGERNVFLDHNPDPESIRRQIGRLIEIARSHGEAIGIAHPHMVTYEVLRSQLADIKRQVRLVPASEVVHITE
ncbi:MAG: divergent polysaccharide deacetylase family protein [Pseudomonadota bacterium]